MARTKRYTTEEIKELGEGFSLSPDGDLLRRGKPLSADQPSAYYTRVSYTLSSGRKDHLVHRLVYVLSRGYDPAPLEIDHIDRDSRNNHPDNLRVVTRSQNQRNRGSFSKNRSLSAYLREQG